MSSPSASPFGTLTESAVHLAVRAAQRLGIRVGEPRVLHDYFNVLVHLAPSPVVVRVPSLTLKNVAEQAQQQRRELAVTSWLAERGAPVVRPSALVPCEPLELEGRSLTFWEYADEQDPLRDADQDDESGLRARFAEQSRQVPALHAALADCPVELPTLSPVVPAVGGALAELRKNAQLLPAADVDRAEAEYALLEPVLLDLENRFPQARFQVLHGDCPAYNQLRTREGHLFNDFEDTTRGPLEWDVALSGPDGIAEYERAGGPRLDPDLLRLMDRARMLQVVGAMALVPQMPQLGTVLQPSLDEWRASTPLAAEQLPV